MRIVHGSDWHWSFKKLPEADLYVFTGDMLDNYPIRSGGAWEDRFWRIDRDHEVAMQTNAMKKFVDEGGMKRYLGSPDAPILAVRGNHDFVEIATLFEGCNFVHEFVDNEIIEVLGVKATGHRGIPYIYGSWNDEYQRADLKDKFRAMPHADLYLTHYPLAGMLDSSCPPDQSGYGGAVESYGLEGGIVDFLLYRMTPAVHMFGHIHECGGYVEKIGPVTFSNAATTFNVIEF